MHDIGDSLKHQTNDVTHKIIIVPVRLILLLSVSTIRVLVVKIY